MRYFREKSHRSSFLAKGLAASLLASSSLGTAAYAQDAGPSEANESDSNIIVVTARKREENILDVPESIDVISSADLDRAAITSVDELGRQSPGLVLNRRSDNQPNIVMRGVGSFGNVQGVGFYIDEAQTFTDQTMRFEDIERVEILKGPQGTLYGGSNIGGAIRYIPITPGYDLKAVVSGEVGSRDYQNIYGSLNVPVVNDVLAFRISGYWSHDDGYLYNSFLDVENGEITDYGLRAQLLFEPTPDTSALLTVRYNNRSGSVFSLARGNSSNTPNYISDTNIRPHSDVESLGVVANIAHDFGALEVRSITSFARQTRTLLTDLDYTPDPILGYATLGKARPTKVFTQEIRLTSAPSDTFDWLAGLYYQDADNILVSYRPIYLSRLGGPFQFWRDATTEDKSLAAFATANLHFGDLTVGGGLRLQRTKYTGVVLASPGTTYDPPLVAQVKDTTLLPKFSLSYKMPSGMLLYGSVAYGYEPGRATIGVEPPFTYKPETLWQFEAGIKGTIADSLDFNLAAFYLPYKNRQFETRSFDPDGGATIERIDNIGKSESKGVELGLAWRPHSTVTLNGGLSYIDAKWTDAFFGLADTSGDGVVLEDLRGKDVPNTPKWQFNVGATYKAPIANDLALELHADGAYSSRVRWSVPTIGAANYTNSFFVSNARIAIGAENGSWEIAGRVENIFDVGYFYEFYPNYFDNAAPDGTCSTGCHMGNPNRPRRFVLSGRFEF